MDRDQKKTATAAEPKKDEGLDPTFTPDPVDNLVKDDRSLDIGGSGQFAPGGYYNQQNVTAADRIDLDEYTKMRPKDEPAEDEKKEE